jgi:hypothetical protein
MDWAGITKKLSIPDYSEEDKLYIEKIKNLIFRKLCKKLDSDKQSKLEIKKGKLFFMQLSYNETDAGLSTRLAKFIVNNARIIKKEIKTLIDGKLSIKEDLQIETSDCVIIKKHVITVALKFL